MPSRIVNAFTGFSTKDWTGTTGEHNYYRVMAMDHPGPKLFFESRSQYDAWRLVENERKVLEAQESRYGGEDHVESTYDTEDWYL